jgi:F420-dependent methylenetetrahydromethanopterin dehydrogenase
MEEEPSHIITQKSLMESGRIICPLASAIYLLAIYGVMKDISVMECFMDKEY